MSKKQLLVSQPTAATRILDDKNIQARLLNGDCQELLRRLPDNCIDLTVTSPPYCMGKEYESSTDVESFIAEHEKLLPEIVRITKQGGSICWQVGFHVKNGLVTPLDYLVHDIMKKQHDIKLRNRIVWTYGHGFHCDKRFSGRYEVIMWYTKGDDYCFNLDAVRVQQKYPGKRHSKGPNKGQFSGNPKGKNPSDIWESIDDDVWKIPNVKANHIEKTEHPCQFPVGLVTKLVRALSPEDGLILDPFSGVASTGVAALQNGRRFIGAELDTGYANIGAKRLKDTLTGEVKTRPVDKEIYVPKPHEKVAIKPEHFWENGATAEASSI